jgi:hypothetical protein
VTSGTCGRQVRLARSFPDAVPIERHVARAIARAEEVREREVPCKLSVGRWHLQRVVEDRADQLLVSDELHRFGLRLHDRRPEVEPLPEAFRLGVCECQAVESLPGHAVLLLEILAIGAGRHPVFPRRIEDPLFDRFQIAAQLIGLEDEEVPGGSLPGTVAWEAAPLEDLSRGVPGVSFLIRAERRE